MSAYGQVIGAKVSQRERAFLVEALELLMRERSNALRIATAAAKARGDRVPEVQEFGLDDILRLSRQISEVPTAEQSESKWDVSPQGMQKTSVGRRKPY
ncbi:hypothetical protein [Paraburkholderia sp. 40]|uniref:hypothetical protein n=1 Tax=Paraburkholderia sp. 40 TaxID=2991059 RepID=UPI003D1F8119